MNYNIEDLKYNTPLEVTRQQYAAIKKLPYIAHRYDFLTNKYYIKLWNTKYKYIVYDFLNKLK